MLHFAACNAIFGWIAFLLILLFTLLDRAALGVAVRLRSAKNRYGIRDRIAFESVRENVGHEPLAVSSLWFWGVMRTDIHAFHRAGT